MENIIDIVPSALKTTAGQRSLTVATAFVTPENLCRTATMTANTKMRQQLLKTTITILQLLLK